MVVEEGSVYPALYRMERRGWVEAEWGASELGRRAELYRARIWCPHRAGATPRDLLALVARSGGRVIGVGVAIGLAGAAALGRSIASILFGE